MYERIFRILQRQKVDYLIAGGMAVNLYGVPRFTKDLDILVHPSKENLVRLVKALDILGFRSRVGIKLIELAEPVNWEKWKKEKGLIAFNLFNPQKAHEEIDILMDSPVSFSEAKKRNFNLKLGSLRLHVVSIEDLIKMKKRAGRKQDLADIEALKQVQRFKK